MKKISARIFLGVLVLATGVLAGCGPEVAEEEKLPFFVSVQDVDSFDQTLRVEKVGQILGRDDFTVTAQAAGRVAAVRARVGESVLAGQLVVGLVDELGNYQSRVESSKNALDRAILQRENSLVELETAVNQARNSLVQAEENYVAAVRDFALGTQQTSLDREQSRANLTSAEQNLVRNFRAQDETLRGFFVDVQGFLDPILGISQGFFSLNDSFESELGARNSAQKNQTIQKFRDFLRESESFELAVTGVDSAEMIARVDQADKVLRIADELLRGMDLVFANSVTSDDFTAARLAGFDQELAGLQTALGQIKNWFDAFAENSKLALDEVGEEKFVFAVGDEKTQISVDRAQIGLETALLNAEIGLQQAEENFAQAQENLRIQRDLLGVAVADSEVAYRDALVAASKLSVVAPMRGVVTDVLVEAGQEVAPGAPIFSMMGVDDFLVEFGVFEDEIENISVDSEISVLVNGEKFTGFLYEKSSVADAAGLFAVTVGLRGVPEFAGTTARVIVESQKSSQKLLPLDVVTIVSDGVGIVKVFRGGEIVEERVALGEIFSDSVVVRGQFATGTRIVVSDVSSFDPAEFALEVVEN